MRRACVVLGVVMTTTAARADDADDLVAKGEDLGRHGEWTQAITSFKHADVIAPRTNHACMIALAYTRREHWAQAELYFRRCHERAKPDDPVPDWAADAEAQLATKIAGANVPAVTITVTPSTAATIAISGFEADETTVPGVVHLAPGHYTIQVSAQDYLQQAREVEVPAATSAQVAFTLVPLTLPNPDRTSRLPLYVMGAGAALVVAGVVVDYAKVQPLRDELAKSQFEYRANEGSFGMWRTTAIGLWATGAIAIGIGAWLEVRRRELPFRVNASVGPGAASVEVSWPR
jgi:hypothetical protein